MELVFNTPDPIITTWFDRELSESVLPEVVHKDMPTFYAAVYQDGLPVIFLTLFNIDTANCKAEFGIVSMKKGTALVYAAGKQFLKHAFYNSGINRIYIKIQDDNKRALTCAKCVGFVLEGIERASVFRNGRFKDLFIFSILRHEFERVISNVSSRSS